MLSTVKALKEWDRVLKLLSEVKAYVAEHPNDLVLPTAIEDRVDESVQAVWIDMANPMATWKQLLKRKVNAWNLRVCLVQTPDMGQIRTVRWSPSRTNATRTCC